MIVLMEVTLIYKVILVKIVIIFAKVVAIMMYVLNVWGKIEKVLIVVVNKDIMKNWVVEFV